MILGASMGAVSLYAEPYIHPFMDQERFESLIGWVRLFVVVAASAVLYFKEFKSMTSFVFSVKKES